MSEPKTKQDAESRIAAAERKDRLAMSNFRADMHKANAERFEARAAELRAIVPTLPG